MKIGHVVYATYVGFFLITMAAIIAVPLLQFQQDMGWAYEALSYTCHQKMSRSLCVFSSGNGYWVADCLGQGGSFISTVRDRQAIAVQADGALGYKIPVCARDFGLYGAMLIGALIYPFFRRIEEKCTYPAIWLMVAIVPLALDGGIQLVSEIGLLPFVYESTNAVRLLTGVIAGVAASFYAIPILMNLFGPAQKEQQPKKAAAKAQKAASAG